MGGIERKSDSSKTEVPSILPENSLLCDLMASAGTFPTGFESPAKTLGNMGVIAQGGAESGAVGAPLNRYTTRDGANADLARIVHAWTTLPAVVRSALVAIVDRAQARGDG
jgi:hypothetical protein